MIETYIPATATNIDIESKIRDFKKAVVKSCLHRDLSLKAIAKPSLRRRKKGQLNEARKRQAKKRQRVLEDKDFINKQGPSWRFIYQDGECFKVPERHRIQKAT